VRGERSDFWAKAKDVNGRYAHVQRVEVEFLLAASLAVGEPCVLLCISNHKLNLVAQPVAPYDLRSASTALNSSRRKRRCQVPTRQL
jgi:hypothetical protein